MDIEDAMDRLLTAAREYERLVPHDLDTWSREAALRRAGESWIRQYLLPGVDELWQRPRFQEYAAWPQHNLTSGLETEARRLVQDVDDALVSEARALLGLAKKRSLHKHLKVQFPSRQMAVSETVAITAKGSGVVEQSMDMVDELPMKYAQVEAIASHCWSDLVSAADYFCPTEGPMGRKPDPSQRKKGRRARASEPAMDNPGDNAPRSWAKLLPFFNRDLLPVGDLISRCMMTRVDEFTGMIHDLRIKVNGALGSSNRAYTKLRLEEAAYWKSLDDKTQRLREYCFRGQAVHLRDAAIRLAQVYMAFAGGTGSSTSWLQLPAKVIAHGSMQVRANVAMLRSPQTLDLLALSCQQLRRLYPGYPPMDAAFDEAVARGDLVLCENPRMMYWRAKLLSVAWQQKVGAWDFWVEIARKTQSGQSLRFFHLYSDAVEESTMASRKLRAANVVREFAPDLAGLLVTGEDAGSYELNIHPTCIHIFANREADV